MAAAPPQLSLESSILFALNQNPAVKAEMEKIKQANFAISEARSAYYPQVSVKIKGGREYDNPAGTAAGKSSSGIVVAETNSASTDLVINQVLFNGFATREEIRRRKSLENSATLGSLIAIEGILQNSIQYYIDVWSTQRSVTESQAFVAALEKIGAKISLMNEAGAESKAKKEYVDSRVAAAHSELNKDEAALADALSNLQSLTGYLPEFTALRPLQLDPTVRPLESYYGVAREDNNRLLLNRSDHTAVEHQIKVQEAAFLPTVNLELNGRHAYDVGGHVGHTWNASAMVVVDYKIFDGFAHSSTTNRLKSQKAENEFRQEQLERDLNKDIRKSYNQILATKQDLANNMREILSSENLQELYTKQFELGEGDIITMIEGSERLHTARIKSFKLEANLVTNSYTMLQKAGALRKERFCASC
jgi:adhesin transport system outer membrane protein